MVYVFNLRENGVVFQFAFGADPDPPQVPWGFGPKSGPFGVDWGVADVSWISPYPNEKEWLLCRGFGLIPTGFGKAGGKNVQVVQMRAGRKKWAVAGHGVGYQYC